MTAPSHATGTVEFVPLSAVADDGTFRVREEGDVAALAASIGRLGQLAPVELRPIAGAPEGGPRYQIVAGFRRLAALRLLVRERVLARVHADLSDDDAWAMALADALLTEPLDEVALAALRERLALMDHAPWADELLDEALVRAPVAPELRERFYEFLGGAPVPEGVGEGAEPVPEDAAEAADAADAAADAEGAAPAGGPAGAEGEVEVEIDGEGAGEDAAAEGAEGASADTGDTEEVTPEELAEDLAERLWQLNQDLAVAFDSWKDLPEEGRRLIARQARYVAELYPLIAEEDDEG